MSQTNKSLPYDDLCLTCIDCNSIFDFPATEQDFFEKHGLASPKRCRRCRTTKQTAGERQAIVAVPSKKLSAKQSPVEQSKPEATLSTKEVVDLRSELRLVKMEVDELKLEIKEIQLYFKAKRIARLEKQTAAKV
jgi:hypothetical protein